MAAITSTAGTADASRTGDTTSTPAAMGTATEGRHAGTTGARPGPATTITAGTPAAAS